MIEAAGRTGRSAYLLLPGVRRLREDYEAAAKERDDLRVERDALAAQARTLSADLAGTREERDNLLGEAAAMREALERCEQGLAALREALARTDQRLAAAEALATRLDHQLPFETQRVDYLLAAREGIIDMIEPFHAARATEEYRAAFTTANPLVSVSVITAHRPELLVTRCLHSLRNQTYRNLQIIVVGDHCMDDTEARVAALRDDRIIFHNLPRRGPYPRPREVRRLVAGTHPANKALSMCEGQFVTHLDDDDRFEPERIETMVAAAQAHEADFLWHPFWWETPDGSWRVLGDGSFAHAQIGTSSVFYHRYFTRIQDDVYAYRIGEPGDWNRLRKIKMLRPKTHFVDKPLVYHYTGSRSEPFVPQPGEQFLE